MSEQTRTERLLQVTVITAMQSFKNRIREEKLFWKTSIKKERLGAIAVFVAIGAVGSIVYTVFNLIF
jgi:hypothetical protein